MADVTDSGRDRGHSDRAQLVLVGGVVVAFALVALVLLLNTALFAENIATRGLGPAPDDATTHAVFAGDAAERILRHEERIEYRSWSNARENATENVLRVGGLVRRQQFKQHGAFAELEVTRVRRGAALVQNATGPFDSDGGADDWNLTDRTDGANGTRNFTMTVDATNTVSKADAGNFTVVMEGDAGRVWAVEVYANESGPDPRVELHTDGTTCRSTASTATINWTAGTLSDCSFPVAVGASGDALQAPYTLRFRNGTNATGTYRLVVSDRDDDGDGSGDSVVDANFAAPGSGSSPRQYPAVYSIVLQAAYERASVDYDTHVRVAPGEPTTTRPTP